MEEFSRKKAFHKFRPCLRNFNSSLIQQNGSKQVYYHGPFTKVSQQFLISKGQRTKLNILRKSCDQLKIKVKKSQNYLNKNSIGTLNCQINDPPRSLVYQFFSTSPLPGPYLDSPLPPSAYQFLSVQSWETFLFLNERVRSRQIDVLGVSVHKLYQKLLGLIIMFFCCNHFSRLKQFWYLHQFNSMTFL